MADDPLQSFDEKLRQYRANETREISEDEQKERDAKNMNAGIRAGSELIATTAAGTLIGYGLDRFFETQPLFLIIFLLAGISAGFFNIYRITQNIDSFVGYRVLSDDEKDAKTPAKEDNQER